MKVEPIRDPAQIAQIERQLSQLDTPRGDRMLLMFEVGIWLGMRIGDMLQLRVGDLRGQEWLRYTPQKTAHRKGVQGYRAKELTLAIAPHVRRVVDSLCADQPDDAPLFPSPRDATRPISRATALNDMHAIREMAGIQYSIGCHTLRKTFGYHIYRRDHDVAWLQAWYGHSSPAVTLIYIGIADDDKRKVIDKPLYTSAGVDWQAKKRKHKNQ